MTRMPPFQSPPVQRATLRTLPRWRKLKGAGTCEATFAAAGDSAAAIPVVGEKSGPPPKANPGVAVVVVVPAAGVELLAAGAAAATRDGTSPFCAPTSVAAASV